MCRYTAPAWTEDGARELSTLPITSPPLASTIATESGEAERSAMRAAG